MPPSNQPPFDTADRTPPSASGSSSGPVVGIIIIVVLLVVGAFYFWGAHLNAENPEDTLPLILGDSSTTQE